MKILKKIKEKVVDFGVGILRLIVLIIAIPVIWWMMFCRWLHEKIWGR